MDWRGPPPSWRGPPAAPAAAQTERIVEIDTLNVRDVLYHLGGGGGNGLALIDEINGGVVLIDTKPPGWGRGGPRGRRAGDRPAVTTIINTHAHAEHAGSNAEFPDAGDDHRACQRPGRDAARRPVR